MSTPELPPSRTVRLRDKVTAIRVRTLIIAVCALGTSLWQGYTISRHNKLMVQPYLQLELNADMDGTWSGFINNNGLGPAKVTHVDYFVDGKPVSGLTAMLSVLGERAECYGTGGIERFYRVNDRQQVLRTVNAGCGKTSSELNKLLSRIHISMQYESLYGEQFTLNMFAPLKAASGQ